MTHSDHEPEPRNQWPRKRVRVPEPVAVPLLSKSEWDEAKRIAQDEGIPFTVAVWRVARQVVPWWPPDAQKAPGSHPEE